MAKQLNVNLAFTADTGKAKAQLQDLQRQLTNLVNKSATGGNGLAITADIEKAVRATAELQVHLQKAVNTKTGNLDFSKLSDSLRKSNKSLDQYADSLRDLGPEGYKAFQSLATSVANAEIPIRRSNAALSEMWVTLKNAARWQLSSSMLHGFMGAVQSAYGYAQDLNKSLNDIRIVTGQNIDQMAQFAEEANKAAKALSASTTEYTNASLIYYQQGLNDQEVKDRTDLTIKMAHASGQSAEIVSDQLTAIWNNFYDGSQSLEHYADVLTKLGAETASSSEEISTGLEKFAAIGDMIGLSYDNAAAALATVTATTRQSAEVVGTAFKTIFARIQGLNLGETLDDGTTLNKYSQALDKVGISIKDQHGELKDMDVILAEMGDKWKTLSKDQQIALAQTVAGTRQYNQLVALMENFDFYEQNLVSAQNAEGSLQAQADIYAESWEAAQKRVKAASQAIYQDLLNDEAFIDILNSIEKILTGFDKLIDSIGGLGGVLSTLGAIVTKVFHNQMAKSLSDAAYSLKMMTATGRESIKNKKIDYINYAAGVRKTDEYDDPTEKVRAESLKREMDLQIKLIENSDRMSQEELEVNKILMDRVKIYNDLKIKAAELLEQKTQQSSDISMQARAELFSSGKKDNLTFEDIKKKSKDFGILQKDLSNVAELRTNLPKILEDMKREKKSTEEIFDTIVDKVSKVSKLKGFNDKDELIESNNKSLNDFVNSLMDGERIAEDFDNVLAELNSELGDFEFITVGNIRGLKISEQTTDELVEAVYGRIEAQRNLNEELKNGAIIEDKVEESIEGSQGYQRSWADGLVSIANSASATISVLQILGNAFETISDPNISSWEKFTTVLTGLTAAVPMLTMVFNKNTIETLSATSAAIGHAFGLKTEAVALNETTMATKGFGTTLAKSLIPLGATVIAIGALVLAIKYLHDAYNADADAAKEAADRVKDNQEAYNNAKTAVEDFKASLQDFGNASKNIEDLTKGTKEYEEAVKAANDQALELIKSNNLLKNQDWQYNNEGIIEFLKDENGLTALDRNLSNLERAERDSESALLQSQIISNQANLRNQRTNTSRQLGAVIKGNNEYVEDRQLFSTEIESIVDVIKDIKNADTMDEELLKGLVLSRGDLSQSVIDNIDAIFDKGGKDALIELAESAIQAKQANEEYTKSLIKNSLQNEHDAKLKELATNENGELNQGLYNLLSESLTELTAEKNADFNDKIESVDVSGIDNSAQLNNYLKENGLYDIVNNMTGSMKSIEDDEQLALTYAQMLLGRQGKDVDRSSLSYQIGVGKGTVRDAEGNLIVDKVNDDVMRREIAQWAMMEKITSDFETSSKAESDNLLSVLGKLQSGANTFGEGYGADFTGALLSSLANGNKERLDLSGIYNQLDPEEVAELQGLTGTQLRESLGLSRDDILDLGYKSSAEFAEAFKAGLEGYDPMQYWTAQTERSIQGQEDAKLLLEGLQSEKDLTEEQIAALDRLKEKYSELADTKNLSQHEYLALVREVQEEEEDLAIEGLEEQRKLLNEKLSKVLTGELKVDDTEFQKLMDDIQNNDYSIKMQIEADLASDVDQAFGLADELANLQDYVGESLKITYDKAQEIIAAGYGAMLQNAKETSDGTIELNKATVNAFIDGKQSELDADRESKIAQLEGQREMLVAQLNTLKAKGEALNKARTTQAENDKKDAMIEALRLEDKYRAQREELQAELENDGQQKKELGDNAQKFYDTLSTMYTINSENEQNATEASDLASEGHQKNVISYYNQMQKSVVAYSDAVAKAPFGLAEYDEIDPIGGGSATSGYSTGQTGATNTFEAKEVSIEDLVGDLFSNANEGEINDLLDQMIADNQSEMDAIDAQIGSIDAGIAALKSAYKSLDKAQASAGSGDKSKEKDKDAFDIEVDKLKKIEEESERYHEVKEALQSVGYELDDIAKKKDRVFGANKLKAIEAETKALKKQQKVQKEYVKEIEGYLKQDTEALTKYGASLDVDGNISNYDEIVAQQVSTYNEAYLNYITAKNEAVAAYNASAKDESADKAYNDAINVAENQWKAVQNGYETFKNEVKQYEESLDLLEEQQQALVDMHNQLQDLNYEKLTYKLELELIVNENEMKELDYYFGKMEGDIQKSVEAFGILKEKLSLTAEGLADYEDHLSDLEESYANGDISQADYIDGLQNCYDNLYDNLEALSELDEQMMAYYGDTYDLALEKIEKYTSQMESLNGVLEHYKKILSLIGKENDFETMGVILEGQVEIAEDAYSSSKAIFETAKQQKEEAYQELMNAKDDAERELLQQNYDKAVEEFNNAQEQMLSDAETYAQAIKDVLVNSMEQAAQEMEKAMTGVYGSFEQLQEVMSLHSMNDEEYLTNTNKLYETNKMLNQIAQDMEKTENRASKAKYQAFAKEIEQLQEKDKLSKLELEIAQAKYNMLQAQIALEDAQNAKSMVRLTRDSEGNFGYVYTADKDKVNKAEQDLADAENDLYNIRLDAANEYAEKKIQAQADMAKKLAEIDKKYQEGAYASEEEYQNARNQIIEKYTALIETYSDQYAIATGEDARVVQDAWTTAYDEIILDGDNWRIAIEDYTDKVATAFELWRDRVKVVADEVGGNLDQTKEKVKGITSESEALSKELKEDVIPTVSKTLTEVRKLTTAYATQRDGVLDLAKSYEELAKSVKEAIAAEAEQARKSASKNDRDDDEDTSSDSKDPNATVEEVIPVDSGKGPGSTDPTKDGILNVGDTVTFTGGVYYNDSEGGGPTGSRGPGKKVKVDRIKQGAAYPIHVTSGDSAYGWLREDQLSGFNTGGYTGEWGSEGKLAILHEKEIVLNAQDTENLLATVSILRELTKAIDLNATWASMGIGSLNAVGVNENKNILEQQVEIHAEFPNATDRHEIEEAFSTLINRASQYANRF